MAGISNYEFERSKVRGGFKFISKLSYMNALDLLSRKDPEFLKSFLHVLTKSVQFEAYFFEAPPMTEKKVQAALVICGLFICDFVYIRLKNGLFPEPIL
jgi:hypothetical protein